MMIRGNILEDGFAVFMEWNMKFKKQRYIKSGKLISKGIKNPLFSLQITVLGTISALWQY